MPKQKLHSSLFSFEPYDAKVKLMTSKHTYTGIYIQRWGSHSESNHSGHICFSLLWKSIIGGKLIVL